MSDSLDIGVDVDSKEFVPAVADRKAGDRIANTRAGIAQWLNTLPQRCRIGMEATGRYYELLARMAGQAGHVVYVINPRLIKHYGRATGSRGKRRTIACVNTYRVPMSSSRCTICCASGRRW